MCCNFVVVLCSEGFCVARACVGCRVTNPGVPYDNFVAGVLTVCSTVFFKVFFCSLGSQSAMPVDVFRRFPLPVSSGSMAGTRETCSHRIR